MDLQDSHQGSSLSRLAEELILDAQASLVCTSPRVEDALRDLKLARVILAFSHTTHSEIRRIPCHRDQNSIHSLNASQEHLKLRRCRKYSGLRDIYNTKVEIQRMEIASIKPKVVYIKRPVIVGPSWRL